MGDEARKSTWFNLARAVWSRRKWLGLVVFLASFAAAVGLAIFLPKIYRSTATVLIERQQVPETLVRPSVTGELETRFQTMSQEILSRARLKELITRFDLYPDPRRNVSGEEVVERMRRDIHLDLRGVEQTGGRGQTVAFALSYRGRDPKTVAKVTNTLASFYVEENAKVRERQTAGTTEFLKAQAAEARKRLDAQERQIGDFKTRYLGELPQQLDANRSALDRLNAELRANTDVQLRVQERREGLSRQLAEVDATTPDARASRLAKLKEELMELRTRYTDKYPDIVRLKSEIATLEQGLAEKNGGGAGGRTSVAWRKEALNEADDEIKALKQREKALRQAINGSQQRIAGAPRLEQELQRLTRDYEAARELYYSLAKRHEEAQLAEDLEQRQRGEQFRILDVAVPAESPAAPHRLRLILVGLLGSLAVAVAVALIAEQLDTSFHSVDDLRAFTKIQVVASIPRIVARTDTRRQRRRFRLGAVSTMLVLGLIVGASYYIAHENEQLVMLVMPRGR